MLCVLPATRAHMRMLHRTIMQLGVESRSDVLISSWASTSCTTTAARITRAATAGLRYCERRARHVNIDLRRCTCRFSGILYCRLALEHQRILAGTGRISRTVSRTHDHHRRHRGLIGTSCCQMLSTCTASVSEVPFRAVMPNTRTHQDDKPG